MTRLLAAALVLGACRYPKYAVYTSPAGDFKCQVPYTWQAMTENAGDRFSSVNFLGPFEPQFYLGTPSFGVRWHGINKTHGLPGGSVEMYSGVDDYVTQTLSAVYAPGYVLTIEPHEIVVAGRRATHFVVVSPTKVSRDRKWGVAVDKASGEPAILRQHAYVLVPMEDGFYVLVYPATRDGFSKYEKEFNNLVNSFAPLKNGPAGAPVTPAR